MFYYQPWATKYVMKLREEIEDLYNGETIKSIYIGGGSPSVLTIKEITYLLKTTKTFNLSSNYEFTV